MILKLLPLIMIFNPIGPNDYTKGIALIETNPNNFVDTENKTLGLSFTCVLDTELFTLEHQETYLQANPEMITFTLTGYYCSFDVDDRAYTWYISGEIYYQYANANYNYKSFVDIADVLYYTGNIDYTYTTNTENYTFCIYVSSETAYNEGYTQGYTEGHNRGEQIGYQDGYRIGKAEGEAVNNVITWFTTIWDGITDFMSLQVAPNLTIGSIITIPLVVGVLFFVLKVLIQ